MLPALVASALASFSRALFAGFFAANTILCMFSSSSSRSSTTSSCFKGGSGSRSKLVGPSSSLSDPLYKPSTERQLSAVWQALRVNMQLAGGGPVIG